MRLSRTNPVGKRHSGECTTTTTKTTFCPLKDRRPSWLSSAYDSCNSRYSRLTRKRGEEKQRDSLGTFCPICVLTIFTHADWEQASETQLSEQECIAILAVSWRMS